MTPLVYWVWLQTALGVGNERSWKLIEVYGDITKVYENRQKNVGFLTQNDLEKLNNTTLQQAQLLIDLHQESGYLVLCYDSKGYPEKLKNTSLPPLVLYTTPNFPQIVNNICIGVVGTRKMSAYGKEATEYIVEDLVKNNVVIISGLAYGVDTVAHQTTVKNEGLTIAVMGCGLDRTYPAANKTLRKLIESKGALVSEFPLGTAPFAGNFPIRNRVISGLSDGLLVTEADEKSGTLITAKWAFEDQRDVFAVPSNIFLKTSQGTNRLIQNYAKLVTCAKDILVEFDYYFDKQLTLTSEQTQLVEQVKLTAQEQEVLEFLTYQPTHLDDLVLELKLETQTLLEILTKLELFGLIDSYAGKRYSIKL